MTTVHVPILAEKITEALLEPLRRLDADAPPHWIVDCTLGGGGHTSEFLKALSGDPSLRKHRVLSVDQDGDAIERARERFAAELAEGRLELFHGRMSEVEPAFEGKKILGLLADLGFSSDQMDDPSRGLSFRAEGPLDMRLDPSRGTSCREYLQRVSERELADVIHEFGEERFARRIAGAVIEARRAGKLPRTTLELADLVVRSVPPPARHGRIHAATRTFQALRIVINEELKELESLLSHVILHVIPGGRIAILSFHSLEDRKVKLAFRGDGFEPLTKKPVEADEAEVERNPRSRSAKLRVAERT